MPRLDAANMIGALVETGAVRFATQEEICRLAQSPAVKGDYEKQADLYELAVERKDDPAIRQRLAETLERAGRRELAAAQFKTLADSHLRAGDLHAGADFLRQVVRLAPNDRESRELLIDILLRLKSPAQASIQIRRMAQVFAEEGQIDKAIEEYRRLLKIEPGDFEAQKQLVELLVQQERIQDAFNEAEVLETFAKRSSEHDQVIKFFGRLVATRPGFTAAQKKLERISRQERRKIKMRTLSKRALVLGGLALAALVGMLAYEWLAWVSYRPAFVESETWVRRKDYQMAVRVLHDKRDSFPYSRAQRSAELRMKQLVAEQERMKKELQEAIAQRRKDAEDKEKQGDLKGAAEALMWVAQQIENEDYPASFDLKLKARKLMNDWAWAEQVLKRAQESAQKPDGCKDAHSEILRLWNMFPNTAAMLHLELPVHVTSTPPGAQVTLAGKELGKTPLIVYKTFKEPLTLTLTGPQGESATTTLKDDNDWQVNVPLRETKP